jgi:hypothetical protein
MNATYRPSIVPRCSASVCEAGTTPSIGAAHIERNGIPPRLRGHAEWRDPPELGTQRFPVISRPRGLGRGGAESPGNPARSAARRAADGRKVRTLGSAMCGVSLVRPGLGRVRRAPPAWCRCPPAGPATHQGHPRSPRRSDRDVQDVSRQPRRKSAIPGVLRFGRLDVLDRPLYGHDDRVARPRLEPGAPRMPGIHASPL